MSINIVKTKDTNSIEKFLGGAGKSLETFRYFETRPIEIINNHLITLIGLVDKNICAYGHLEQEGGRVWLGVCVQYSSRGNGYGSEMMGALLDHAARMCIDCIWLTVDTNNLTAIHLYEKLGFVCNKVSDTKNFYKLEIQ